MPHCGIDLMKLLKLVVLTVVLAGGCTHHPAIRPANQLLIRALLSPVVYNGDTNYFLLDVENYQPDSTASVLLSREGSDSSESYRITYLWEETPTRLRVWLIQNWPIKPGIYNLTLRQSNGQWAKASQQLEVKAGQPKIDPFTRVSPAFDGQPVVLSGQNLFSNQDLSLTLTTAYGQAQQVPISTFSDDGSSIRFRLPPNTQPGYYSLSLQIPDASYGMPCQRFSVLRSSGQPYVLGIEAKADPYNIAALPFCPDTSSVLLSSARTDPKNAYHSVTFGTSFYTNITQFAAQVKLVSLTDQKTYRFPLQLTDEYNGSWYELKIQTKWFEGKYRLDSTMAADRYKLSIEYMDKHTGQTQESEPYEHVIQLQ